MNYDFSPPVRQARMHADKIFATLFVAMTPVLGVLAYLANNGAITHLACQAGGGSSIPAAIAGSWEAAILIAGLLAIGSILICQLRPAQAIGGIYNASAAMVFSALFMHFGGGAGEAHFPFFIFTSLLLYYRARWPIALASILIVSHHLGFYTLQTMGVPVVLFDCLDRYTLLVHMLTELSQCALLGYIAARMEYRDRQLKHVGAQQQLAASVFHNTIEGIVITEADGTIVSVNPAFTQITGYSAKEAVGKTPRLLKSNRHDAKFYEEMWRTIDHQGQWQGQIWNRRKSGEVFLESQTIKRLHGEDGVVRYVAVFNDITEQWRKDQRIAHLAFHDSLTGLANRSLLNDRLRQAVALAERSGATLAIIVVDLDRFKNVNDTFGHEQGDELLRVVAARLQLHARETDTVARLGGDEFAILLQNPGQPEDLAAVATRLLERIAEPIELAGLSLRVGASIGIAVFPTDGRDGAILLKNADTAMYDAKANGKNTYRFFSSALTDRAQARLHLEMDLRRAIERGELELHYQPKICLSSGLPCSAEALVRWRHPLRGLVSPLEFIPLAEETGLIEPIGKWVLEEACRQLDTWRVLGTGLAHLAVNVSAVQLRQGRLAEQVSELLARYNLPGAMLEIELTESTVMNDPDHAIKSMEALRALGVKIAIDDFGTGYSSLSYLQRLPIDTLKIDRSFVAEAAPDTDGAVICNSIIGLARNLRLNVVAEGIETVEQLTYLRQQGCHIGQGYYFCRPQPQSEFNRWLSEREVRNCMECIEPKDCKQDVRSTFAAALVS